MCGALPCSLQPPVQPLRHLTMNSLSLLVLMAVAAAREADSHFSNKMHASNRLDAQLGFPGMQDGAAEHGGRRSVQVSPSQPSVLEVRLGERMELECEAFGSPPPSIQWLRDGLPISDNNMLSNEPLSLGKLQTGASAGSVDSATGIVKITSRLVVDCALPIHRGTYTCAAASITDGDVSAPTSVYVEADGVRNLSALLSACQRLSAPPRITSFASFVMDVSGSDITLPCAAEGNPRPAVFWKDNNNQVIVSRRNRYKLLPNGSLIIFKVRWSDMGAFTCVAQSDAGRDNATTFVYPLAEK